MNTAIYYFSGTGNSYFVARDIANKINGEIVSIPSLMPSGKIEITAEVIGIVFPDYHSNLPNIIKRFINQIDNFNHKYLFAVCTYGGEGPGLTVKYLEQLIKRKGGKLAAGFAVKMPYNYIVPSLSLKKIAVFIKLKDIPVVQQQQMFLDWNTKLEIIIDFIKSRKTGRFETTAEKLLKFIDHIKIRESLGKYLWLKMAGFNGRTSLSFSDSRQLMDHGFHANANCVHCGTCVRVCPVNNIKLIDQKPAWQHHCEQCFACLQWCPQAAIQFGRDTENNRRYHHPQVKVADLIWKREDLSLP